MNYDNIKTKMMNNLFAGLNLRDLLTCPTRITDTEAKCLDHIITDLPYSDIVRAKTIVCVFAKTVTFSVCLV